MLEGLRKLLGRLLDPPIAGVRTGTSRSSSHPTSSAAIVPPYPQMRTDAPHTYYRTMAAMQSAISRREYTAAAELARENLAHIPDFIQETVREFGTFDIPSIPALERGGTMLALAGDRDGLEDMSLLVERTPELAGRRTDVERHIADMEIFGAITRTIEDNPGCLQTSIKEILGEADGRRISNLIAWLEKAGRIHRRKSGSTFALTAAGSPHDSPASPSRVVASHRQGVEAVTVRKLELARVPYVPLPRSPLRWEERQDGRVPEGVPEPTELFELRDASGWSIASLEKVPIGERPDTAFRKFLPIDDGLILVDDLGKAAGLPDAPASAIRFDRGGRMSGSQPLLHDVYRIASNPLGQGLIAMSKECVLHAYDDSLRPIVETALLPSPEVQALIGRLGIDADSLRTHLRAVALSHDGSRYLVTGVDEAWCIGADGHCHWRLRFPLQEGWTEIAEPAGGVGTSVEIAEALTLIGLSLPVSAADVRKRYRDLAKQWHPQNNPDEENATERMVALNAAAELLTGVDTSALPRYTGVLYEKMLSTSDASVARIDFSFSVGMVASELHAADWIYAAAFAGRSHEAFLAGYSGRVVHLDQGGMPVRVYDIGAVPRAIVDTDDYLYFLTDTRLYVLQGDVLHAVVDTFEGGELIMGQTGFALVEKKRLRWFREDGHFLGSVITKNPIRRAYHDGTGLVVETRQRRAVIAGAPSWWE